MEKGSKIFVAGHRGLVGSAIVRRLEESGYTGILTRTREELDLTNQAAVEEFFSKEEPEYVFLAAAKVGGILANSTYPGEFIVENLLIQTNVIRTAHQYGARKLMFLGSSCIYPKYAQQPIREEELLTGPLEPTNEAYAIAKISGIKLCKFMNQQYGTSFISVMPTNLYGPNDNFDLETSHVLPALLRKFHEAKLSGASSVTIWGTGTPKREFLHVDDLADAVVYLMERYESRDIGEFVNVGTGKDISILELGNVIAQIVGFTGNIKLDTEKPDGTSRKLLDVSRLNTLGWEAKVSLTDGLRSVYDWAVTNGVF